jgi:crossover junction endodeoxyribonuclease RuvC
MEKNNPDHLVTIGIDPGVSGALAMLIDGQFHEVVDWVDGPTMAKKLLTWVTFWTIREAALEKVSGGIYGNQQGKRCPVCKKPLKQVGATSAHTFGVNCGWWKGALDALEIPWTEVAPQTWQKGVVPKKRNKNDKPSLTIARQLFPDAPLRFKKHHGRADALLIAHWAYLRHN